MKLTTLIKLFTEFGNLNSTQVSELTQKAEKMRVALEELTYQPIGNGDQSYSEQKYESLCDYLQGRVATASKCLAEVDGE